jgi:copper resistance protein B
MSGYVKVNCDAALLRRASGVSAVVTFGLLLSCLAPKAGAQVSSQSSPGNVSATIPAMQPPVMDNGIFYHVLLDQFEGRTNGPDNEFRWDGEAWIGTDMNRLWLKSEGFSDHSVVSDGDQEALYDRPIPRMKYFDAQVGVRADLDSDPSRAWAALGIQGLAPYQFQFAPTLYISDGGHVAGRITGFYDVLLTQRLIAEPEAELNFYSKDDPARKIGSGLSDIDTGVRLRYEISRKFAPYIGFGFNGKYGNSSRYTRQAGESTSDLRFVFGVRLWY